ncbi:MAG: PilZ domain-containing protein, partial [Bdellovibrionota bacterium]
SVWLGRSVEGSAGGSGVVIENATLVPGQTVLLHFAAREDLPAFNALCEIVGKKFVGDIRDAKTPVQYSLRFVKLDSQAEPRVQKYFHSKAAKAA